VVGAAALVLGLFMLYLMVVAFIKG